MEGIITVLGKNLKSDTEEPITKSNVVAKEQDALTPSMQATAPDTTTCDAPSVPINPVLPESIEQQVSKKTLEASMDGNVIH